MKIGLEVEGRLKGIPSAFMSAEEFLHLHLTNLELTDVYKTRNDPAHYYISDHDGIITLGTLKSFLDKNPLKIITLEVKNIPKDRHNFPNRINLMLYLDGADKIANLYPGDQVKWVTQGNDVFSVGIDDMHFTDASDFNNDTVLGKRYYG